MIEGYPRAKLSVVPAPGQALIERKEYAAKIRAARALLGWSQAELGQRVGVTQRSINRLENADVDVRRSTAVAIDAALKSEGIWFEELTSGGYRIVVQRRLRAAKPT